MKAFQDKDLQTFIGNLLRYGVIIAMVIVIAGLAMYLFRMSGTVADYSKFNTVHAFSFSHFLDQLKAGHSDAIMELGVITLITIPIARVIFTMFGFWLEKDRLYTGIAFIVLCIIAYSLLFGVSTH